MQLAQEASVTNEATPSSFMNAVSCRPGHCQCFSIGGKRPIADMGHWIKYRSGVVENNHQNVTSLQLFFLETLVLGTLLQNLVTVNDQGENISTSI